MDAFAHARPAAMHDTRTEGQWGEVTLVLADLRVRSGLSVPVELGGGSIGTQDLYAIGPTMGLPRFDGQG